MKLNRAILSLLLAALPACAATITYNATVSLDPTALQPRGTYFTDHDLYNQSLSGEPSITVQAGDVVTGTITFTNGSLGLRTSPGDFSWGASFDFFGNAGTDFTSSVQVLGLTGNLVTSNPTPNGSHSLGNSVFGAGIPGLAGQNYTFTGMAFTINLYSVESFASGLEQPVTFSLGRVEAMADAITVNVDTAPEPASLTLSLSGFLLLAVAVNRRK